LCAEREVEVEVEEEVEVEVEKPILIKPFSTSTSSLR